MWFLNYYILNLGFLFGFSHEFLLFFSYFWFRLIFDIYLIFNFWITLDEFVQNLKIGPKFWRFTLLQLTLVFFFFDNFDLQGRLFLKLVDKVDLSNVLVTLLPVINRVWYGLISIFWLFRQNLILKRVHRFSYFWSNLFENLPKLWIKSLQKGFVQFLSWNFFCLVPWIVKTHCNYVLTNLILFRRIRLIWLSRRLLKQSFSIQKIITCLLNSFLGGTCRSRGFRVRSFWTWLRKLLILNNFLQVVR